MKIWNQSRVSKSGIKRCWRLAGLALVVLASIAMGQDMPQQLGDMVVTASRQNESIGEISSNITVIDSEQIELSSAGDLGELLAEVGSGHIHKYPGALTSVGLRGFRTDSHGNDLAGKVLILINGRRAGTGNVAKILTDNVERIEILRGGASVQYGSAAVGGVINVITKEASSDLTGSLRFRYGSNDYHEEALSFSTLFGNFDLSAALSLENRDEYDTGDGTTYFNTGLDDRISADFELGYTLADNHRFSIHYNLFTMDKIGNPGSIDMNDKDNYVEKEHWSMDLAYEGQLDQKASWSARYFFGEDDDYWYDPVGSNASGWDNGGPPSFKKADQRGAQAQFQYDFGMAGITVGSDWLNYEIDGTYSPNHSEYDNLAGFTLGKLRLLEDQRLVLTGGMRYDRYKVDMGNEGGSEDDTNLTSQLGVAYALNSAWKLRANYTQAFKIPTAQQLASDYPGWGGNYIGNPDLDPETSDTYELGVDYNSQKLTASLTWFTTSFEDKIQTSKLPGGDTTWENLDSADLEGIEAELQLDVTPAGSDMWRMLPYIRLVKMLEYRDNNLAEDLKYISDLTVSYGVTVKNEKGFSANLNVAYTGEQDIDNWAGMMPGNPPVLEKDSFTVANLTLKQEIHQHDKLGTTTLSAEIRNLFDEDYAYVRNYPMPGRQFFVGLEQSF